MTPRVRRQIWQTLCVFMLIVILLVFARPQINLYLRDATLLSFQRSDLAYLQAQQIYLLLSLVDVGIFACIVSTMFIWREYLMKAVRRFVTIFVVLLVISLIAACSPKKDLIIMDPNEVIFLVSLVGDADQTVAGLIDQEECQRALAEKGTNEDVVVPEVTDEPGAINSDSIQDETYWRCRMVSTSRFEIVYSRINTGGFLILNGGDEYPTARALRVNTSSREIEWHATRGADVDGDGSGDWASVFSGQSINSEGLYTGMVVQARIKPEDAALYLASFGDRPLIVAQPDANGIYNGVLQTEVQNRLQDAFSAQVGIRTIDEINTQLVEIFDIIEAQMIEIFAPQGLTIEMVGNVDGIVYENDALQEAIDNARVRELELESARNSAQQTQIFANGLIVQTQAAMEAGIRQTQAMHAVAIEQTATQANIAIVQTQRANSLIVENAGAQATAVYLQGLAEAEALNRRAEAMGGGANLALYEYYRRWNGQYPSMLFGGGLDGQTFPDFEMFMMLTPPAQASATPTATPTPR